MPQAVGSLSTAEQTFVDSVKDSFQKANLEFARAYYLFATARLEQTYQSAAIYQKYPLLQAESTFQQLKVLYDRDPHNEEVKRLFVEAFGTYISNRFAQASDELTNLKNNLKVDLTGLGITDKDGQQMQEVLFEDTSELFKRLSDKTLRDALYERASAAYTQAISPKYIALLEQENAMMAELGYADIIGFYSQASGHHLHKLGKKAREVITQTQAVYIPKMSAFYQQRTGLTFEKATRADTLYVFNGQAEEMAAINTKLCQENLLPLATQTFDQLGLKFSDLAQTVDFASKDDYIHTVDDPDRRSRILLDIAHREGKRSRAYVYPARAPQEIYLSVKPEGGLDDYAAFFHESGHAQHFAYVNPDLSYPLMLMGNNTVTESYAYLFQNLFLNRHWLIHRAGLSPQEAVIAIRKAALNDLYMLRRYASKMQFELALFDGKGLTGKPEIYEGLLTEGTGFLYDAQGWTRDVDAGFYVADYFTAWTLEAQLRDYLQTHYGSLQTQGEDWYQNPQAGAFLQNLWWEGNLRQDDLSARLGFNDPTEVGPLLKLMMQNLGRQPD